MAASCRQVRVAASNRIWRQRWACKVRHTGKSFLWPCRHSPVVDTLEIVCVKAHRLPAMYAHADMPDTGGSHQLAASSTTTWGFALVGREHTTRASAVLPVNELSEHVSKQHIHIESLWPAACTSRHPGGEAGGAGAAPAKRRGPRSARLGRVRCPLSKPWQDLGC